MDDFYEKGSRQVRQIAAFGPRTMESFAKATMFIAVAESAMNLASHATSHDEKEALIAAFGAFLGLDLTRSIIAARGKKPKLS